MGVFSRPREPGARAQGQASNERDRDMAVGIVGTEGTAWEV